MTISLRGSVGKGGQNQKDDVEKVQQRLKDLGYSFVGTVDGLIGSKTIHAIKLFQSIKGGHQTLRGDGRVDVNGDTHKWLNASNAPKWQKMSSKAAGFENIEVTVESWDNHDYGTSWLDRTITTAGAEYKMNYYDVTANSSLLTVNDTSLEKGGDTRDHKGHETGLSCDLRLPQKNNTATPPGNRTFNSADYDRDATRAILVPLRNQPLANHERIFFNDGDLIRENLCSRSAGHDDHIHFEVKPPVRQ